MSNLPLAEDCPIPKDSILRHAMEFCRSIGKVWGIEEIKATPTDKRAVVSQIFVHKCRDSYGNLTLKRSSKCILLEGTVQTPAHQLIMLNCYQGDL